MKAPTLLLVGVVCLLCVSFVHGYVSDEIQAKAKGILSRVDYDTSKLSEADLNALYELGFSKGDLFSKEGDDIASTTSAEHFRFKQQLRKAETQQSLNAHAEVSHETEVQGVVTLPTPPVPICSIIPFELCKDHKRTGNKFFIKAFIPGPGCSSSHLSFVNTSPKCSDSAAPKDGWWDDLVLPSPGLGIMPDWFRGDARCTSSSAGASYRLGAMCELFKNSVTGKYRVTCSGNAGYTHHYERRGILSNGCWYLSCDKLDSFNPVYFTDDFDSSVELKMDMTGSNPCVTGAPSIVMDFKVTITVGGGKIGLKLNGEKSQFPAMEGYYLPKGGSPSTWFYWSIGDRTVLSLLMPNKNVDWDKREFNCVDC